MARRLSQARFGDVSALFQLPLGSRTYPVQTPCKTVATSLEFRILGPLEVLVEGAPIRLGGPKQRALLAFLLLSANAVVSRDRLIEELFSDQPSQRGDRALRVQISRLRKLLSADDDEPRLVTRPPGYLLRVDSGELDLYAFEQRLAEGRRAMTEGDPVAASAMFREAEAFWRGHPLADLEFEPFARIEIERLEELRLTAIEERIDAELELGREAALVSELQALVAEYPLRERLQAQLMLALYRSGRQADALASYRKVRVLLTDELALEPSPRLRELEQAMLRQDPGLELPHLHRASAAIAVSEADHSEPRRAKGRYDDRPSKRGGARLRMALIAAAALAVAIVVPLKVGGAARVLIPADENGLVLVSAGQPRTAVRLDTAPADVVAGFGSLWVSEGSTGTVARVDPNRHALIATIQVGREPDALAVGSHDVWVVNSLDGTLSRIDPGSDKVAQTIKVGSDPSAVAVSGGYVWVANETDGTVQAIGAKEGRPEGAIATGDEPSALAVAAGTLWVANTGSGTVSRIDVRTRKLVDTRAVGDAPSAIVATRRAVWVLDQLDSTVSRLDPVRDTVASTQSLAGAPSGIAVTKNDVWVTDARSATLIRLNRGLGRIVGKVHVGGAPQSVEARGGLWVAVDARGTGHRGGTLTELTTNLDTIDPASTQANDFPPTQIPGLLNDGLVTLDHAAGVDGARLVPDLALALPTPTDGGRTYTFRLRARIRYSTGGLVRPTDVRHSFERLFEIGSAGTSFFTAIVGAATCAPGRHCELSRGIAANNRTHTVTFHLSRPDPDFLYKLTIEYADVLPASTPDRLMRKPLPATGPYEVSSYVPGRKLILVRNPYFREWSAAAQPSGYPARIVTRIIGPHEAFGAALVAHAKADFMWLIGGIPSSAREYFVLHHPAQVHTNPILNTGQLGLNVHAAPFNDVRVRRALNYALNRARIAKLDGGSTAAQPTCQILPPGLTGYQRYCPYTSDPSRDGRWRSPNLPLARRLVAASGTAGMRVEVWDSPEPQFAVNEGRVTVAALRQLGYRATLHLSGNFLNYANNSRNHAQVIDGGAGANYPATDGFLTTLTCAAFVPNNAHATGDSTEFCNHAIDRQIERTASLQRTDPTAASAAWAGLDRQLTNLAVWVPTVTPNETDLLSKRVGNYQYNPVWGPLIDQLWVR
jgi:YVTN family beta-propeller protein